MALDFEFRLEHSHVMACTLPGFISQTNEDFLREYEQLALSHNVTSRRSSYISLTYDSVWTVALTLRKAQESGLTLSDFNYTASGMKTAFSQYMGKLDFMGVSVRNGRKRSYNNVPIGIYAVLHACACHIHQQ